MKGWVRSVLRSARSMKRRRPPKETKCCWSTRAMRVARPTHCIAPAGPGSADAGAAGRAALPPDMVSALLREAAEHLAEITGDEVSDRIVDTVFSRFCVGK